MLKTTFNTKIKKIVYSLLLSFVLAGCFSKNDKKIDGIWSISNIEYNSPEIKSLNPKTRYKLNKGLSDDLTNRYIYLETDSSFHSNFFNTYFVGTWSYNIDNKLLSLHFDHNENPITYIFETEIVSDNKLRLKYKIRTENINKGFSEIFPNSSIKISDITIDITMKKDNFEYKDKSQNIYTLENNSWRIKPTEAESEKQIKKRLENNIHYFIIYMENSLLRNENAIDMSQIYSPIKNGSNGIALKPWDKTPSEWKSIFYNEEQAFAAYNMLSESFQKNINIPETNNWLELNIALMKQICAEI